MVIMTSEHLKDCIPYRRTVWISGFLKTTISSALISTGVVLIFNSLTNHPMFEGFYEAGLVIGISAIILAILIIVSIDKYKEGKKKEELETIESYIDRKAEEIANMKVLRNLEKLEDD